MPREVKTVGNIVESQDIVSAQFCGRFGVALRLIKGSNGFHDYSMENINDPAILSLVHKIDYIANEALEMKSTSATPAIVTIKLKNGEVFKKRVDYAKGTINNPLKTDELKDKFRELTSPALSSEKIEKIIETLMNLEEVDDISRLLSLLTVK